MNQHGSNSMKVSKVLFAVLAALLVAAIALVPQASKAHAALDRRNVSVAKEANGLPVWYQDAKARRVFQCTDAAMCGAEGTAAEVVYWAGEASIPVGRKGIDLVMAVEGSFMNPDGTDATAPDNETIPVTGSVLLSRGDGLKPNAAYRITYPYGVMQVRTDNTGKFRKLIENGCDIEAGQTCNPRLALSSPIFKGFLRWDPKVGAKAPAGFYGNPEVAHPVVGSPSGTNYLKVELVRPGKTPDIVIGKTSRFSITGQKTRGVQTDPAAPEGQAAPTDQLLGGILG
jgi:hypothetical protein